jgi:hypothetical protein
MGRWPLSVAVMAPAQIYAAAQIATLIAIIFGSTGNQSGVVLEEAFPEYAHRMMLNKPVLIARARPMLAAEPNPTANQLKSLSSLLLVRAHVVTRNTVNAISTGYGRTSQKKKRDGSGRCVSVTNSAMTPQTAKRTRPIRERILIVFILKLAVELSAVSAAA